MLILNALSKQELPQGTKKSIWKIFDLSENEFAPIFDFFHAAVK